MSDSWKRKSNTLQESLVIVKEQKNSNKAQTVADLSDLRWLPPVLHFPEPLNFTKVFLANFPYSPILNYAYSLL